MLFERRQRIRRRDAECHPGGMPITLVLRPPIKIKSERCAAGRYVDGCIAGPLNAVRAHRRVCTRYGSRTRWYIKADWLSIDLNVGDRIRLAQERSVMHETGYARSVRDIENHLLLKLLLRSQDNREGIGQAWVTIIILTLRHLDSQEFFSALRGKNGRIGD